ncbi:DnaJ domain-containing protein [Iningainema tapete]|uniref:DnaJ domain-containing protein n=1 Tax=Iningainema tapete BLCC-T55 TaxID=2748662 RepID=A0A8J7C451_9CYAN|nr:DnaJ domain-containing protein [Iningainema tapete]MBD2770954.1 DnaJ domain-containing protein [Iningainema tapete BLCC-T55]
MAENNYYETLKVNSNASQAEIKQAYRRLVKLFHPDTNQETANNDQIIQINAAYEVLGDAQSRLNYDQKLHKHQQKTDNYRQQRTAAAQKQYQATRKTGKDVDEQVEDWLCLVYQPVNRILNVIIYSLQEQIDKLSADPFDDDLLEEFQDYLNNCRNDLKQAQITFSSLPNPPSLARTAAHLYYCLNQTGDGLDDLEYFPLNYDESYLHTGQEMFRIAAQLYREAQDSVSVYA